MKSVERHNLQTNTVAHGLEVALERYKPYLPYILGAIGVLFVGFFIWSLVSSSSASRRSGAWDSFHEAVGSAQINLDQLRQTASEYPGTKVQELADLTWADGQVARAADLYIYHRKVANEALQQAAGAYRSVLQTSESARLQSRARLGLARVYEMQGEIDKAKEEYSQVQGTFATYAKAQAERLADPETKETYEWLATAEPPRSAIPQGPGTPGKGPDMFPSDIPLPGASGLEGVPGAGEGPGAAEAFDALLKEMQKDKPGDGKTDDRYKTEAAPATEGTDTGKESPEAEPPKGLEDSPRGEDSK